MLSNVIDVDEAMMEVALTEDNPAAFLFDFEAAFPSIDHSYILDVLTARGWPAWFITFITVLYWNNVCYIAQGGKMDTGFSISAGVRQGCPLSPLLFSIVSDVLLRRITRLSPSSLIRAYADDIAIVERMRCSSWTLSKRYFSSMVDYLASNCTRVSLFTSRCP